MKHFQSTKIVEATNISVTTHKGNNGGVLYCGPDGATEVSVTEEYFAKYDPRPGGYFLRDGEGNESYRTAEDFEAEFSPIQPPIPSGKEYICPLCNERFHWTIFHPSERYCHRCGAVVESLIYWLAVINRQHPNPPVRKIVQIAQQVASERDPSLYWANHQPGKSHSADK